MQGKCSISASDASEYADALEVDGFDSLRALEWIKDDEFPTQVKTGHKRVIRDELKKRPR